MATTVFPVTDQVATKALFDSLKLSVDRGDVEALERVNEDAATDRLRYDFDFSTVTAGTAYRTVLTLDVDKGQTLICEMSLTIEDWATNDASGDFLEYRLSVTSGVKATGIHFSSRPVGFDDLDGDFINTTSNQSFSGRRPADPDDITESRLLLILVGDSDGGSVSLEITETPGTASNAFICQRSIAIARRIL